ncbi:MAG: arylesterase [Myxococcota bacterium]|nr:arylesterase [Myxococcota bacterium]
MRVTGRVGGLLALLCLVPLLLGADGERVVLCLGDSLTEGYGVEDDQAYPSVLERRLRDRGKTVRVINAGINGSTSASAVRRLRWQLKAESDLIVLALGGNDGLRGLDLAETKKNLSQAIELAKSHGVQVVLAGMQIPPNYGADYTREFRAMFPALAEEHDVVRIPFLLEGVAAQPELNLPDGIHPNAKGYERVVENVLAVVEPLL